jgi:hypothetical protein
MFMVTAVFRGPGAVQQFPCNRSVSQLEHEEGPAMVETTNPPADPV